MHRGVHFFFFFFLTIKGCPPTPLGVRGREERRRREFGSTFHAWQRGIDGLASDGDISRLVGGARMVEGCVGRVAVVCIIEVLAGFGRFGGLFGHVSLFVFSGEVGSVG